MYNAENLELSKTEILNMKYIKLISLSEYQPSNQILVQPFFRENEKNNVVLIAKFFINDKIDCAIASILYRVFGYSSKEDLQYVQFEIERISTSLFYANNTKNLLAKLPRIPLYPENWKI